MKLNGKKRKLYVSTDNKRVSNLPQVETIKKKKKGKGREKCDKNGNGDWKKETKKENMYNPFKE